MADPTCLSIEKLTLLKIIIILNSNLFKKNKIKPRIYNYKKI